VATLSAALPRKEYIAERLDRTWDQNYAEGILVTGACPDAAPVRR
jgi:hypothetical protein